MATVPPSRLHELKVSVPPGCSENCRRAGQGVSGHGEPGPRRVPHPGVALVPSPPTRLTCGRVARERAAPGAARSPELPALSQLFLLVLPPPALSHGRGATAQPGDGGRAAGSGRPSPARSAGKDGSTCSARSWGAGRAELPASWARTGGLQLLGWRSPLASRPGPFSAPPRSSLGSGRAPGRPRLLGEGLRAAEAALQQHKLETPPEPKQTCTK